MRFSRLLLLLLIAGALAAGEGDHVAPPRPGLPTDANAPAAVSAELTAFAARAVELGLPDAQGGRLVVGTLVLTPQAKSAQQVAYSQGIHLQLADGRWLPCLGDPLPPGWTVDSRGTTAVAAGADPIAALRAHCADAKRSIGAEQRTAPALAEDGTAARIRQWFDRMEQDANGSERVRFVIRMINGAYGTQREGVTAGHPVPVVALVHLARVGSPLVAEVATSLREGSRQFANLWNAVPPLSDGKIVLRFSVKSGRVTNVNPADHWRWQLHRAFRLVLLQHIAPAPSAPKPWLSAERAAAAATALLNAGDPPHHRLAIDLLLQAVAVPVSPPQGADLAARLATWRQRCGDPMHIQRGEHGPDTSLDELGITDADRDGLVALLDDPRPTVAIDDKTQLPQPRTLGDQALRAFILRLGVDPRSLVGHDPEAAWTPAERAATAEAIAAWWKTERGHAPGARLVSDVTKLAPKELASSLKNLPEDQRTPVFDALVQAWVNPPAAIIATPDGNSRLESERDTRYLGQVLRLAKGHAGIEAAVAQWPVAGGGELLLAAWHALRDRHEHLDRVLDRALATPLGKDRERRRQVEAVFGVVVALPSTSQRLGRLASALRGPLDGVGGALLWQVLSPGGGSALDLMEPDVSAGRHGLTPALVGRLALVRVALDDLRPLPARTVQVDGAGNVVVRIANSIRLMGKGTPAADARVCDLAAALATSGGRPELKLGLPPDALAGAPEVELTAALPERDAALREVRKQVDALLVPALKAAGLSALPPPGAPASPDPTVPF